MKYLILLLACLISLPTFAEEIPAYMKDAVITVTLTNGKVYTFSGNEYKVVKRGTSKPKVDENLAPSDDSVEDIDTDTDPAQGNNPNRVKVLAGTGPQGLSTSRVQNTVSVSNGFTTIVGVGYERLLNKEISVGGQVLTNGTYLLDLGYDFK